MLDVTKENIPDDNQDHVTENKQDKLKTIMIVKYNQHQQHHPPPPPPPPQAGPST